MYFFTSLLSEAHGYRMQNNLSTKYLWIRQVFHLSAWRGRPQWTHFLMDSGEPLPKSMLRINEWHPLDKVSISKLWPVRGSWRGGGWMERSCNQLRVMKPDSLSFSAATPSVWPVNTQLVKNTMIDMWTLCIWHYHFPKRVWRTIWDLLWPSFYFRLTMCYPLEAVQSPCMAWGSEGIICGSLSVPKQSTWGSSLTLLHLVWTPPYLIYSDRTDTDGGGWHFYWNTECIFGWKRYRGSVQTADFLTERESCRERVEAGGHLTFQLNAQGWNQVWNRLLFWLDSTR